MFRPSGFFPSVFDPFGSALTQRQQQHLDPFCYINRVMEDLCSDAGFAVAEPPFLTLERPSLAEQGRLGMRPRVTIEEVDDTDEPVRLPAQRPVEYPREAGREHSSRTVHCAREEQQRRPRNSRQSSSYSTCSSSFSQTGGLGAASYSSSSSARMGPGGIVEHVETVQDGRSGQSSIRISRHLGNQGRTITRIRDRAGQETSDDQLHNMQEADTSTFHEQWSAHARDSLLPHFDLHSTSSRSSSDFATGPSGSNEGRSQPVIACTKPHVC